MSCCRTLAGLVRGCDKAAGGIKRAWIACYGEVNQPTVVGGEITAITPTNVWHEYEFREETGSVTEVPTISNENGSIFYESSIVLVFNKQETEKRNQVEALGLSDLAIIIEDNNGEYHYFGYDTYVTMTDGSIETGTAWGDFNGYNLTFTSRSKSPHYLITEEAMAPILAGDED